MNTFFSVHQPHGHLTVVFEFDGDVAYLYVYDDSAPDGDKIKNAMKIPEYQKELEFNNIIVNWSSDSTVLFMKIYNEMRAVIEVESGEEYYNKNKNVLEHYLPKDIAKKVLS